MCRLSRLVVFEDLDINTDLLTTFGADSLNECTVAQFVTDYSGVAAILPTSNGIASLYVMAELGTKAAITANSGVNVFIGQDVDCVGDIYDTDNIYIRIFGGRHPKPTK